MMSRSVDLPQPLGPTRQTNSPSNTVSDTFSKASTVARLDKKRLETLSTTSLEWAGLGWTRWSAKTGDPPLEQRYNRKPVAFTFAAAHHPMSTGPPRHSESGN